MKTLLFLLLLLAPVLSAQLNYSVSSGPVAFVPLAAPTQTPDLSSYPTSALISPAGFAFMYDGVVFNDFRISRNGYIVMGSVLPKFTVTNPAPTHETALRISPLHEELQYGTGTQIGWEFSAGVLTVEWLNIQDAWAVPSGQSPAVYTFQAKLDTATGDVAFCYGPRTGGAYADSYRDYSVSMHGHANADGMLTITGHAAGFISADGLMTQWPTDMQVVFTSLTAGLAPIFALEWFGNSVVHDQLIYVYAGYSIASANIRIAVDDPDGDPCSLTVPEAAVFDINEWESVTAAVPYELYPATGNYPTPGLIVLHFTVRDASEVRRVFNVQLSVINKPVSGKSGTSHGVEELAGAILVAGLKSGCTVSVGSSYSLGLLMMLFALLIVVRSVRRTVSRHRPA